MGFETPQFNTGEVPSENKPEKKGGLKNKLQKLAVFGAIGVAALTGEGCGPDKGSEQKVTSKGSEPTVEKSHDKGNKNIYVKAEDIIAIEQAADSTLRGYLELLSNGNVETGTAGDIFLEMYGVFYQLDSAERLELRNIVMRSALSANESESMRQLEAKVLKEKIDIEILASAKKVTDPSIMPPKIKACFAERGKMGLTGDANKNLGHGAMLGGVQSEKGKIRQSSDFDKDADF